MRLAVFSLLATCLAASSAYSAPKYEFEVFGVPGEGAMSGLGINNNNTIVGRLDYFGAGSIRHVGYVWNAGEIELIDIPEAGPLNGTRATGIRDDGVIIGTYVTELPGRADQHGFILENGTITTVDVPTATDTEFLAVNNAGVIAGRAFLPPNLHLGTAFTLDNGVYDFFLPPGVAGSFGIAIYGINDHGNYVGWVLNGATGFQAFAVINGYYMPFDVPNANTTIALGINNQNQIVGTFSNSSHNHGFLMDATGIYQIDVPEADFLGTFIAGINENGFLAGTIDTPGFPSTQALFASPCFEVSATCIEAPRIGDSVIKRDTSGEPVLRPPPARQTLVFNMPAANAEIPLNTDQVFKVTLVRGGRPQRGELIDFSTTRGVFVGPSTDITDDSGQATVTIRSDNSGPAIVIADATGLSAEREVKFIATIPASIDMQADPVTIAPSEQSTITAIVRDAEHNRVKNATVIFTLEDVTGGTLSVNAADTDSQGRAQTIYTAGDTVSGNLAVTVTGTVESDPALHSFVSLTVAHSELFIALDTSNDMTVAPDLTYQMPLVAIVSDAEGNGVAGVTVRFDAKSTRYSKGYWEDGGAGFWVARTRAVCLDEDQNGNGILDEGEIDENSNGTIEAGNVVDVVPGDTITDENGTAFVKLRYEKVYGAWTEIRVRAQINVAGEEFSQETTFVLPVLDDDVMIGSTPPGIVSLPDPEELGFDAIFVSGPWGYGDSCAENF